MKVIIFLAGIGSRLKKVTDDPKCLLMIGRKPLLIQYLDKLNDLGIKQVILVVGYKQEKIRERIGNQYKDLTIRYIENKDYLKGSILSLLYARDEFDDDIITMDGDILFDKRMLQNLIESKNKNCFLADFDIPDLADGMKIVVNTQGIVTDVNYKIKRQKDKKMGEGVGFIKWSKEDCSIIKDAFNKLLELGINDDVYEMAVRYLINNSLCQFGAVSVQGLPWIFINKPDDLQKARQYFLTGNLNG